VFTLSGYNAYDNATVIARGSRYSLVLEHAGIPVVIEGESNVILIATAEDAAKAAQHLTNHDDNLSNCYNPYYIWSPLAA